ncbi:MAG TPA: TIGR02301 family protein [Aurantimonas sp.]|uniref:TIGR02301 family protein n=1 Tax=Aurantimonas marianensis TaxID=2920428 RepID=A0A9X2H6I8_9HYPH|nr:TIGR02301 family protein [Aurantimonas marianensis]MCP3055131.1 TIGR02301 family protein [Aurantimonas marianensis]
MRLRVSFSAIAVAAIFSGFVGGTDLHAQTAETPAQEEGVVNAEETPAAVVPSDAPYMKSLNRLASILGSMHFLRTLCGDPQAAVWREKMRELIEAQAPNDADRRHLVASFNSGYRAFESTYRSCTPAARVAVNRYQGEGATLAREIGARYGN